MREEREGVEMEIRQVREEREGVERVRREVINERGQVMRERDRECGSEEWSRGGEDLTGQHGGSEGERVQEQTGS